MKLFLIGLGCFVSGAVLGMWLLATVVCKVLDKLEKEGC